MKSKSKNQPNTYILSFTGASLSYQRIRYNCRAVFNLKDWGAVKEKVKGQKSYPGQDQNKQHPTRYQELEPRFQGLSDEQLELLVTRENPQEQKQLLWFAICKRYEYIREFASEVVREKYLKMDFELTEFDYDAFYNRKADWHPELDH